MNGLLAAALLFCGFCMMLDGRADGAREREQAGGGAALFVAGLIVFAAGVLVLLSAARGAFAGAG
jgi:hypothetical protein